MDVSFISATLIIPAVIAASGKDSRMTQMSGKSSFSSSHS